MRARIGASAPGAATLSMSSSTRSAAGAAAAAGVPAVCADDSAVSSTPARHQRPTGDQPSATAVTTTSDSPNPTLPGRHLGMTRVWHVAPPPFETTTRKHLLL